MNSVKALKAKFLLQTYEAILVIVFVDVVVRYGNLAVYYQRTGSDEYLTACTAYAYQQTEEQTIKLAGCSSTSRSTEIGCC